MIKTTEKLTKEYASSFIDRIINSKKSPFNFHIGETQVNELFDDAKVNGDIITREASAAGVKMTATYRVLDYAIEFGVKLENLSDKKSPQIHNIDFCDIELPDAETLPEAWWWGKRRVLYSIGSPTAIYDFQPLDEDLVFPSMFAPFVLEETGGRSSQKYMPYFNCSSCDKEGVIATIGWSGRWKASFQQNKEDGCMNIRFSYPADFYLEAGESVELPHALVMPWKREDDGDTELVDTFNLFRRIMRDKIFPDGLAKGFVSLRSWGSDSMEIHENKFKNMKRFNVPCDTYGIDAEWFEMDGNGITGSWEKTIGDWHEAKSVYPLGLDWLPKKAKEAGAKGFWLWFEFERAVPQSASYKNHPEYYLGDCNLKNKEDNEYFFLNLGNPDAYNYIKNLLYSVISRVGVTMFRVDFNKNPADHFRSGDGENRDGITELKHYNALYKFFGDMLKDFPGMVIDNCANGGRRLDYRLSMYSAPMMCRSDYFTIRGDHTAGQQAQTVGLSRWLPIHGDSAYSCARDLPVPKDTYTDRSIYSCNYSLTAPRHELTEDEGKMFKKILSDAFAVKEYMALDFYPLTGYSYSLRDWCAFQTCSENGDRAMLVAFRRDLNTNPSQVFAFKGINESSMYEMTDLDSDEVKVISGAELVKGLSVVIDKPRDSRILLFKECKA